MPYGITQCYLPPGRGDILAFTPAKLVLDIVKLVLDIVTPEGCKAKLPSWLVMYRDGIPI